MTIAGGSAAVAFASSTGMRRRFRREHQGQRRLAVPCDREQPRGAREACGIVARGNRHRRAGLRGAARGGDAGLDIERIESAGLFQRMQAVVSDALEEGGVGIEQPVKPVDQDAGRQQIEQCAVALQFAARRRLGLFQPFRSGCARNLSCRCSLLDRLISDLVDHACLACMAVVEPRRQLPGEFVESVVLDRGEHGRSRLANRTKRQDVLRHDVLGRFH